MSITIENITERQLRFGIFKVAAVLAFGLLLAAFILSLIFSAEAGKVSAITLNALLIAVAVMILANGCLAILQIFDWFEARRAKRQAKNG